MADLIFQAYVNKKDFSLIQQKGRKNCGVTEEHNIKK